MPFKDEDKKIRAERANVRAAGARQAAEEDERRIAALKTVFPKESEYTLRRLDAVSRQLTNEVVERYRESQTLLAEHLEFADGDWCANEKRVNEVCEIVRFISVRHYEDFSQRVTLKKFRTGFTFNMYAPSS